MITIFETECPEDGTPLWYLIDSNTNTPLEYDCGGHIFMYDRKDWAEAARNELEGGV
jgi:hypothetical protein